MWSWSSLYSSLRYFSYGVALGLPVAVTFADYVGIVAAVAGNSMRPTLNPSGSSSTRDMVWVDRWSLRNSRPCPGDIVALRSPTDPGTMIKRVVAVDGQLVHTRCKAQSVVIPPGHCWVEGDNGKTSRDSNLFGAVSQGLIVGRATHIVWPPQRWGRLNHQLLPSQSQRMRREL